MDGCKVYAITQPAWTTLSSRVQCRCATLPLRFPKTLPQCWAPKIETRNVSVCICLWCLDLLWESSGNGFPAGESLFGRDRTCLTCPLSETRFTASWNMSRFPVWVTHCALASAGEDQERRDESRNLDQSNTSCFQSEKWLKFLPSRVFWK